jgi:flagellar biogenesis protein FliO
LATASAQPRAEASPTGIAKWIPLVLAGAALLVWLRKRQAPGIGAAAALPVSLVGKLRVAPHAQLAVVKAGREHLLLGITPTSVSLVAPLSADVVAQWNAPEPPPARDFPGKSTRNWLGGKR